MIRAAVYIDVSDFSCTCFDVRAYRIYVYIYIYICIRVLHICICIPVFGLVWICMYTYPYVMIYIVGVFGVSPPSVCVVTARLIKVS